MTRLISLDSPLSRRRVLVAGALLSGVGAVATAVVAAPVMRTQKMVQYQETPKGRARCDNCSAWVAPDACKLVSGKIAATGWCTAYAPKV